jgi:hypothetical protein
MDISVLVVVTAHDMLLRIKVPELLDVTILGTVVSLSPKRVALLVRLLLCVVE